MDPTLQAFCVVAGVFACGLLLYFLMLRPWHKTWGTNAEEANRQIPGDAIVKNANSISTHSITISAPAAEIWPWLIQIGQARGGFYSYEFLERMCGFDIRNVYEIKPEWQDLKIGDGIKLHQDSIPLTVEVLDEPNALVFAVGYELYPGLSEDRSVLQIHKVPASTWQFFLDQKNDNSTRLIVRDRVRWNHSFWHPLTFRLYLWELAHSIMQVGMNRGLRKVVENARIS